MGSPPTALGTEPTTCARGTGVRASVEATFVHRSVVGSDVQDLPSGNFASVNAVADENVYRTSYLHQVSSEITRATGQSEGPSPFCDFCSLNISVSPLLDTRFHYN